MTPEKEYKQTRDSIIKMKSELSEISGFTHALTLILGGTPRLVLEDMKLAKELERNKIQQKIKEATEFCDQLMKKIEANRREEKKRITASVLKLHQLIFDCE